MNSSLSFWGYQLDLDSGIPVYHFGGKWVWLRRKIITTCNFRYFWPVSFLMKGNPPTLTLLETFLHVEVFRLGPWWKNAVGSFGDKRAWKSKKNLLLNFYFWHTRPIKFLMQWKSPKIFIVKNILPLENGKEWYREAFANDEFWLIELLKEKLQPLSLEKWIWYRETSMPVDFLDIFGPRRFCNELEPVKYFPINSCIISKRR